MVLQPKRTKVAKYLGLVVDGAFTLSQHIDQMSTKIAWGCWNFKEDKTSPSQTIFVDIILVSDSLISDIVTYFN